MLKSRGRRTHLIILRGCCRVIDFLLNIRHRPVIPDHAFRSGIRHHADLSRREKLQRGLYSSVYYRSNVSSYQLSRGIIKARGKKNATRESLRPAVVLSPWSIALFSRLLYLSAANALSIFRIDFREFRGTATNVSESFLLGDPPRGLHANIRGLRVRKLRTSVHCHEPRVSTILHEEDTITRNVYGC